MAGLTKRDLAALAKLEAIRDEWERLREEMQRLRARRDFLIVAAYRAGIPHRRIAKAAGVHWTRVGQLAEDGAEITRDLGLTRLRPGKGDGAK